MKPIQEYRAQQYIYLFTQHKQAKLLALDSKWRGPGDKLFHCLGVTQGLLPGVMLLYRWLQRSLIKQMISVIQDALQDWTREHV